jgi:ribonuclease R
MATVAEGATLVVCEVSRRGKLLVGEPFFEPGLPLTLGRRGSVPAREGDLVAVEPEGDRRGRVIEVLGRARDLPAVIHGIAVDEGITRPWPEEVEEELAALPRDPLPVDAGRADLRGRLTFTIDPPDARDFDDAITIEREDGGLRLLVHIADVAAFVPAGGPLDVEAERRGCSVYLPGRVEPMLPHPLSSGVCSLQPDVDRYAVTIDVAPDGEMTAYRSMIRSDHRLSYPQVERILAGDEPADPALLDALSDARSLAAELREARFKRGAARVESREVEFVFDEEGHVADADNATEHESHALVEELMLLANERVAQLLDDVRAPAIYRVHEAPEPEAVELLVARLAALDVPTPPRPAQLSPQQAAAYVARISDRVAEYVAASGRGRMTFPTLVLRAMQRARYSPENLGHSGLASAAYCHFTSPIRRYPDLVCHRALLAHVGQADAPPDDPELLQRIAVRSSERERDAGRIEGRGDDVCLAFLLEQRLYERGWSDPFAGEITGLIESALFVQFEEVYDGLLPARVLGREWFEPDQLGVAMVGRTSGRRYRLGDPIEVTVRSIERPRGRVLLHRARGAER